MPSFHNDDAMCSITFCAWYNDGALIHLASPVSLMLKASKSLSSGWMFLLFFFFCFPIILFGFLFLCVFFCFFFFSAYAYSNICGSASPCGLTCVRCVQRSCSLALLFGAFSSRFLALWFSYRRTNESTSRGASWCSPGNYIYPIVPTKTIEHRLAGSFGLSSLVGCINRRWIRGHAVVDGIGADGHGPSVHTVWDLLYTLSEAFFV